MVSKQDVTDLIVDAKMIGNFSTCRNALTDIQDAIRYMSLGHTFKEFLEKNLSVALSSLWDLQHPNE